MAAGHSFLVYKGETWSAMISASLNGSAIDHTGYTIEMDVRTSPDSPDTLLTFTDANNRVNVVAGNIVLSLSSSESAALSFDRGVYDLRVDNGSTVNYYLKGSFVAEKSVTR
jgi:hypothetical protein